MASFSIFYCTHTSIRPSSLPFHWECSCEGPQWPPGYEIQHLILSPHLVCPLGNINIVDYFLGPSNGCSLDFGDTTLPWFPAYIHEAFLLIFLMILKCPRTLASDLFSTYESESEVDQSCLSLCSPVDCSLPGSSVRGIFHARVLEWVSIFFSRGSSRPRDRTRVFLHCRQMLYCLSHQEVPFLYLCCCCC